ncbi:MAG TPA: hypothetical protein VNQ81_07205 [Povalibacter sp.]|nr:hypothetical protein [Povalibacter sp.]
MTQSSEERVPSTGDDSSTARILPFERPQNELQRAVQQRAQERIEAERVKPKVSNVRRFMTLLAALVPVLLLLAGFLVAVQAVRFITSLYAGRPEPVEAPAATEQAPEPSQPGLIMLVPDRSIPVDSAKQAPATTEPSDAPKAPAPAPEK